MKDNGDPLQQQTYLSMSDKLSTVESRFVQATLPYASCISTDFFTEITDKGIEIDCVPEITILTSNNQLDPSMWSGLLTSMIDEAPNTKELLKKNFIRRVSETDPLTSVLTRQHYGPQQPPKSRFELGLNEHDYAEKIRFLEKRNEGYKQRDVQLKTETKALLEYLLDTTLKPYFDTLSENAYTNKVEEIYIAKNEKVLPLDLQYVINGKMELSKLLALTYAKAGILRINYHIDIATYKHNLLSDKSTRALIDATKEIKIELPTLKFIC